MGSLLAGADQLTWVDVDDTIRATDDYATQGAAVCAGQPLLRRLAGVV